MVLVAIRFPKKHPEIFEFATRTDAAMFLTDVRRRYPSAQYAIGDWAEVTPPPPPTKEPKF